MFPLKKCCCCIDLRLGLFGIAIYYVVWVIANLLFAVTSFVVDYCLKEELEEICPIPVDIPKAIRENLKLFAVIIVIKVLFLLVANVLLCIGAARKSTVFILAWLVVFAIYLLITLINMIVTCVKTGIVGLLELIFIVIDIYFFIVVISYYKFLKKHKAELKAKSKPQPQEVKK